MKVKCGNWSFNAGTISLLCKIAKLTGKGKSWLVEQAILNNYSDPLIIAKKEQAELVEKLRAIKNRIDHLEKIKEDLEK